MDLLVIEDDDVVSEFISESFKVQGHSIDVAHDGKSGLVKAKSGSYHVLIVDRMIPVLDGLEVIRSVRTAGINTPILILSALADVDERVAGLDAGADDYLVKPFEFQELLARVNVLSKRAFPFIGSQEELVVSDLRLNLRTRKASRADTKIELQPREFRLLEFLMRNVGQVVTRTMLLEYVWHYYFDPRTNIIDVHVHRIRQKVDKGFESPLIHTVRGAGYVIRETD